MSSSVGDVVGRGDAGLGQLALEQRRRGRRAPWPTSARSRVELQLAPLLGVHGLGLGIPERLVGRAGGRTDDLGPVARHVGVPLAAGGWLEPARYIRNLTPVSGTCRRGGPDRGGWHGNRGDRRHRHRHHVGQGRRRRRRRPGRGSRPACPTAALGATPASWPTTPAQAWHDGVRAALAGVLADGRPRRRGPSNVAAMVPSLCAVDADGVPISDGHALRRRPRAAAAATPTADPSQSGELVRFLAWLVEHHPDAAGYWPAQAVANAALGGRGAIDTTVAMTTLPLFDFHGWDPAVAAERRAGRPGRAARHRGRLRAGRHGRPRPAARCWAAAPSTPWASSWWPAPTTTATCWSSSGSTLIVWAVIPEWREVDRPVDRAPHRAGQGRSIGGPVQRRRPVPELGRPAAAVGRRRRRRGAAACDLTPGPGLAALPARASGCPSTIPIGGPRCTTSTSAWTRPPPAGRPTRPRRSPPATCSTWARSTARRIVATGGGVRDAGLGAGRWPTPPGCRSTWWPCPRAAPWARPGWPAASPAWSRRAPPARPGPAPIGASSPIPRPRRRVAAALRPLPGAGRVSGPIRTPRCGPGRPVAPRARSAAGRGALHRDLGRRPPGRAPSPVRGPDARRPGRPGAVREDHVEGPRDLGVRRPGLPAGGSQRRGRSQQGRLAHGAGALRPDAAGLLGSRRPGWPTWTWPASGPRSTSRARSPGSAARSTRSARIPALGQACVRAFNDWFHEEWWSAHPGSLRAHGHHLPGRSRRWPRPRSVATRPGASPR